MNSRWNPNSKWRKISEFISKVNPMNYIPRRSGQNTSRPSNVELIDLGQDISNNAGYTLPKPVKYIMGGLAAIALAASATVGAYNYGREYVVEPTKKTLNSALNGVSDTVTDFRNNQEYIGYPDEGKIIHKGVVKKVKPINGPDLGFDGEEVNYYFIEGVLVNSNYRANLLVLEGGNAKPPFLEVFALGKDHSLKSYGVFNDFKDVRIFSSKGKVMNPTYLNNNLVRHNTGEEVTFSYLLRGNNLSSKFSSNGDSELSGPSKIFELYKQQISPLNKD